MSFSHGQTLSRKESEKPNHHPSQLREAQEEVCPSLTIKLFSLLHGRHQIRKNWSQKEGPQSNFLLLMISYYAHPSSCPLVAYNLGTSLVPPAQSHSGAADRSTKSHCCHTYMVSRRCPSDVLSDHQLLERPSKNVTKEQRLFLMKHLAQAIVWGEDIEVHHPQCQCCEQCWRAQRIKRQRCLRSSYHLTKDCATTVGSTHSMNFTSSAARITPA